ncbi:MAG: primosomal protein N', partial [Candidatus Adiutrix sp.]|nr:primosomal protein N' [Candidatus Adiutrix sp.]
SYFAHYVPSPLPQARSLAAKGLVELSAREVFRDDPERALAPAAPGPPPELTAQQSRALAALETALAVPGGGREFLLFGVTGSGKTEVYLRAAAKALAAGREVLWLTPEIGLTLGLEGLLKSRLGGDRVAVLHSGLSAAQRHDQWRRIRRGLAPVVLGARSAVFAPLENLGLVVVDEEHDLAYKQDDGLRYHGRDLARWRASQASAVLVLGSATPSFESYQAALSGRLTLLEMNERPGAAALPRVTILDQRAEPARGRRALSPALGRALAETLARGEQALLFLNRRGLASLPMCLKCGQVMECPHCSRSLTLHGPQYPETGEAGHAALGREETLVCHACGYRADPPAGCPHCLAPLVRYFGVGTERLLKIAVEACPQARGARLDADSTRRKGGLKNVLDGFGRGEFNLLVGTQMAAKGHDFPNLTLVGVVDADLGLNLPDFRAAERTFQLLSQVAGRAGRGAAPGTVLIQTLNPRHHVLKAAAAHDYRAFFQAEIEARRELGYPPFSRLALIRFSGPEAAEAEAAAAEAAEQGRRLAAESGARLEILGPAPAPLARLKEQYRFQLLVRGATAEARRLFLAAWLPLAEKAAPPGLKLTADIDPYHFL